MIKALFRETFIMILLCIAIALLLGVIFYDYIPTNKAVPNKLEAYVTPSNIEEKIDEEIIADDKKEVTYTITGTDLNLYKQTNSFVSGKANPFAASTTTSQGNGNDDGTTGSTVTNSSSQSGTGTATDPNSTGSFFNNTGLK